MSPDGSTSGITSVLVFGAGTNYALLLISRYREELGRNENHRDALRRGGAAGGSGDRGEQRHRRAGAADAAARLLAQHPQPRRAGGVGSRRGRGVRAAGAAAPARAVRPQAVLAVHPASSARNHLPTAAFGTASPTRSRAGLAGSRWSRSPGSRCCAPDCSAHRSACRRPNSSACRRNRSAGTKPSPLTSPAA